jgi:hypothetical protein
MHAALTMAGAITNETSMIFGANLVLLRRAIWFFLCDGTRGRG